MKFQGGQFILERGRSKACLERWRYWIDQDPDEPLDQIALLKVYNEFKANAEKEDSTTNGSNVCKMIAMSKTGAKRDHIAFPSRKEIQSAANQLATDRQHYSTLIHIKNTGNALEKTNDEDMERYLRKVLNLSDASTHDDILGITKKIPRIQAMDGDLETE